MLEVIHLNIKEDQNNEQIDVRRLKVCTEGCLHFVGDDVIPGKQLNSCLLTV